jgi:hypothetical protein
MDYLPTKKRNVFVLIQARDLNEIRPRIEARLKKFDRTVLEVMPGVWHLATARDTHEIHLRMVGAVTDWEDDRVLILDSPDGFAGWDGHRGQYCRSTELEERFVLHNTDIKGKRRHYQRQNLQRANPPVWVARKERSV